MGGTRKTRENRYKNAKFILSRNIIDDVKNGQIKEQHKLK